VKVLVKDCVGMWMGQVLQRVRLQGRDPLVVDLAEVGQFVEVDGRGYLQEIESGGV
jgi:hypothetical protein